MKYIRLIILLSVILLLISCNNREQSYCVTYKVSGNNGNNWLVSYRDTCGYVQLETTKNWTKDVCLTKNEIASLMVIPKNDLSVDNNMAFRK